MLRAYQAALIDTVSVITILGRRCGTYIGELV